MLSSHAVVGHHVIDGRRSGRRGEESRGCGRGEVDEEMDGSTRSANDELGDLEGGERSLKDVGHTDVERGEGVVSVLFSLLTKLELVGEAVGNYHKGVNKRVEDAEDPDGGRHKTTIDIRNGRE